MGAIAVDSNPDLTIVWLDQFVEHDGIPGQIGRLSVGSLICPVMRRVGAPSWPEGTYEVLMATMRKARTKALWLPKTSLFGHPANWPEQLDGCWAPGKSVAEDASGVVSSRLAMTHILDELGGFEEGKKLTVRVVEG